MEQHVCCAAVESPVLYEKDEPYFGPGLAVAMQALYQQGSPACPSFMSLAYNRLEQCFAV